MMSTVRSISPNARVRVAYELKDSKGTVLEAASEAEAVDFQLGAGSWPLAVEVALLGEQPGARVEVPISAADRVFGDYDPERVKTLPVADFGEEPPNVGCLIEFRLPDGESLEGQVLGVEGQNVRVDFNHPYVARDLVFLVTVLEVFGDDPVAGDHQSDQSDS